MSHATDPARTAPDLAREIERLLAQGCARLRDPAELAAAVVRAELAEHAAEHGDGWRYRDDAVDLAHARAHLATDATEDLRHALTRLALLLARRAGA